MRTKTIFALLAVFAMLATPLGMMNAGADDTMEPISVDVMEAISVDGQEFAVNHLVMIFTQNGLPKAWTYFDCFPTEAPIYDVLVLFVEMGDDLDYQDGEDMVITGYGVGPFGAPTDESKGFNSIIRSRDGEFHVDSVGDGGVCYQNIDSALNIIRNNDSEQAQVCSTLDAALNIIRNINSDQVEVNATPGGDFGEFLNGVPFYTVIAE